MTDIVAFLNARLDEDEAVAEAAQAVDPGPWTVEAVEPRREYLGGGQYEMRVDTNWRPGHGAATVVAADTNPLWEPDSYTSAAGEQCMTVPTAQHVARHDPARVLAEVKAKRRILALHTMFTTLTFGQDGEPVANGGYCEFCLVPDTLPDPNYWPCDTLKLLAAPYADHPDYDPAWTVS